MKNLSLLLILVFSLKVLAIPVKWDSCPRSGVQEPSVSSGFFYDNSGCSNAYVLPPRYGQLNITGFTVDNELACSSYKDLVKKKATLDEAKKTIDNEVASKADADRELLEIKLECNEIFLVYQRDLVKQEDAESKVNQNVEGYATLIDRREQCRLNPNYRDTRKPLGTCAEVETMLKDNEDEFETLKFLTSTVERKPAKSKAKKLQCDNLIASRENQIKEQDEAYRSKLKKHEAEMVKWQSEFENFDGDSRAGGVITFNILSNHNQTVQKMNSLNNGSGINFQFMLLNMGFINLRSPNVSKFGLSENKSVILNTSIGNSTVSLSSQTRLSDLVKENTNGSALISEAVGGQMQINLNAACEAKLRAETEGGNVKQYIKELVGRVEPTFTYSYSLSVGRKISVKFNQSNLYYLLRKHALTKGLFSARDAKSFLEKTNSRKWINISIFNEGPSNITNDEILAADLREKYFDDAIAKIAVPSSVQGAGEATLPQVGAPGATNAARKCSHLYCQYAALALDFVSKASSEQINENEMQKTVDDSAAIEIDLNTLLPMYGTSVMKVN
jgi:hypothetical protein